MQLPESIQEQVDALSAESEIHFATHHFEKCIELTQKSWELLPTPKEVYSESYHIAEGLVIQYMKLNNLKQARHWATVLQRCALHRMDGGERDMWFGRIAYEEGNLTEAMTHFRVAFRKSKGRTFLGSRNETYYKFYLSQT